MDFHQVNYIGHSLGVWIERNLSLKVHLLILVVLFSGTLVIGITVYTRKIAAGGGGLKVCETPSWCG